MKIIRLLLISVMLFLPFIAYAEDRVPPQIVSLKWVNHNNNDYVYSGDNLDVYVMTDSPNNTVFGWYSSIENLGPTGGDGYWIQGENNGDGSFVIHYTLKTTTNTFKKVPIPVIIYVYGTFSQQITNDTLRLVINYPKDNPVTPAKPQVPAPAAAPAKVTISTEKFIQTCGSMGNTTILENEKDKKSVDFQIDCPKYGVLHFADKLDLSGELKADFLDRVAGALEVGPNTFGLDNSKLPTVGTGTVEVTINNLSYLSEPKIKAGTEETSIAETTYSAENKNIIFKASKIDKFLALPEINLNNQSQTVNKSGFTINGKANDANAKIEIILNGSKQENITTGADGTFSKTIMLADGKNTILVSASNSTGVSSIQSINIEYKMLILDKIISYASNTWYLIIAGLILIGLNIYGVWLFRRSSKLKK